MALAEALKSNTTLETLKSAALPSNPPAIEPTRPCLEAPQHMRAHCTCPSHLPSPCAQPRPQQPRPRGWHGARRGPEEQYHPQDARVCCPAIEPTCPCLEAPQHARSLHLPFSPCLRRVRRLDSNKLGSEGGMALAEALKSNTTLKKLTSAALPLNPPALASRFFTVLHTSVYFTPFFFP